MTRPAGPTAVTDNSAMPDPRRLPGTATTVDRVAEELRRRVFDGELEAGSPLREVALAEALGVSRPTVREALGLLTADGIAVRVPNRGVAVASPDLASIRDVTRARAVLEVAGVRHWPAADPSARDAVRTALASYAESVAQGASYQLLNERHLAVHSALVGLTGSPRLVAMGQALNAELKVTLAQIDRIRRNAHDQADSHTALVDLLERGEVESACRALDQHLADAELAIADALRLLDTR